MIDKMIHFFIKDGDASSHAAREKYGKLAGTVGLLCNLFLCAAKILAGLLFSSISILADGINNLSDATSSVVTLLGFKLSGKPADKEHPFGHARIEYIAGLVISFFIILLGFDLAKSSVGKIVSGEEAAFSVLSVAVLLLSIAVKIWMSLFYRRVGAIISSTAIKASATDSLNDVYATSAVLFCTLVARFTGANLDGYAGCAIALFIIISGIKLVKETLNPLLGEAPDKNLVANIVTRLHSYDGVLGIHDLIVHDYGPGRCFASVHAEMDAKNDVMESHDLTDLIERDFKKDGIEMVVHLDPIVTDDPRANELREMVARIIASLGEGITMHDFRVVYGPHHQNLIFDIVLPADFTGQADEVKARIEEEIKKKDERYFAVINVDRYYLNTDG